MRPTDAQLDVLLNEEMPASPWRRSQRGNLYRRWANKVLTVFPRGEGFAFCVAGPGGPLFSESNFDTEQGAQLAAWEAMKGIESGR